MRLRRWTRQRQDTGAGASPTREATVPIQPTASPDDGQTHGESVGQTQEQVVRQTADRLEGASNRIRNIQAEAERAWARAVRLQSESRARQQYRAEVETARRWGYGVGPVVLQPSLNNDSVDANGIGNGNHLHASNGLRNDHDGRPAPRSQWRQEGRNTDDLEFDSLPTPAIIEEHIMRVFNNLSPDEQPAMTAWIVMMAATQVVRDMARIEIYGEQSERAGRRRG